MDNFDLKKYLKESYLTESELDTLGKELASSIEVKLDSKKDELKEITPFNYTGI